MKLTTPLAAAAAGALALPAAAGAHVTVHPNRLPAGAFTVINVRVPNERDNADTTKVQVQFPPGFQSVSYAPKGGWTAKLAFKDLAKPIVNDEGEKVTQELSQITWTAEKGKGIKPGQFTEFPLSVAVPAKARTLTFKALQTYSDGEVVRWIGAPDSDEPAPQVAVADKDAVLEDVPSGAMSSMQGEPAQTAAQPTAAQADEDSGPSTGLVIVALVLGGLGFLAGLAGLVAARRRPAGA